MKWLIVLGLIALLILLGLIVFVWYVAGVWRTMPDRDSDYEDFE